MLRAIFVYRFAFRRSSQVSTELAFYGRQYDHSIRSVLPGCPQFDSLLVYYHFSDEFHSLIIPTGCSTNSCSSNGVTSKRCCWKIVSDTWWKIVSDTGITTLEELWPSSLTETLRRSLHRSQTVRKQPKNLFQASIVTSLPLHHHRTRYLKPPPSGGPPALTSLRGSISTSRLSNESSPLCPSLSPA
jgi:hypothetical protein